MTVDIDTKISETSIPLNESSDVEILVESPKDWDQIMSDYKDNIQTVDLRSLDAGQVTSAVSGELKYLHEKAALLFVLHNHLPVLFLDELADSKFDYHIKVIAPGEVLTLIFQDLVICKS